MRADQSWADEGEQITVSFFRVLMAVLLAFGAGYGVAVLDVVNHLRHWH